MIYTEQNSLYKRTVSVYLFTPPGRTIFRSLPLKTFHSGTKTLATHTHTDTKKWKWNTRTALHAYLRKSSHVADVIISEVHAAVLKIRAFSSYGLLCNIILCLLCHISGLKQLCRNPNDASEIQHDHTFVVQLILRLIKLETTLRNAPLKMSWKWKNEIKRTICSSTSGWDCGRPTDIKLITKQEW